MVRRSFPFMRTGLLVCCWFLALLVRGQEYNYVRYDTRDGLAGSTVYDVVQDKDGFIWFGTENGLSRFDGKHFKNYTVKDGLPDNEVLTLFADSKGRVWIGTFSKQLSYVENGKIRNAQNDSLLRKITWKANVSQMIESKEGDLFFSDERLLIKLNYKNDWTNLTNQSHLFDRSFNRLNIHYFLNGEHLLIRLDDSLFLLKDNKLEFYQLDYGPDVRQFVQGNIYASAPKVKLPTENQAMKSTFINGKTAYISTATGAWSVDTNQYKLKEHFLPSEVVSRVMQDEEENIWFTTIGNAVFKLPSTEAKTLRLKGIAHTPTDEVYSLVRHAGKLYCGMTFSKAVLLDSADNLKVLDVKSQTLQSKNNLSSNRLYTSYSVNNSTVLLGYDAFLAKLDNGKISYSDLVAIKSITAFDEEHVLVGNFSGAYKVSIRDLRVVDSFWDGRVTKSIRFKGVNYIGTTSGLYAVTDKKKVTHLASVHPVLGRRITGLTSLNDVLYVATSDNGVVGFANGKIVASYNQQNGLSSDLCKCMVAGTGNQLWIGTNAGINRVKVDGNRHTIIKYGVLDGLPSENINALLVEDSMVYVGTPVGLTYFNQQKITSQSFCRLQILAVNADVTEIDNKGTYRLGFKQNKIGFEFTAISFRSAGDINYFYRVKGLDEDWKMTNENSINFPSLPSGDYVFEVYAINKFGVKSETKAVSFSIATPFWKTPLFIVVVAITLLTLTGWLVNERNKSENKRLQRENEMQRKLALLEQQALQAQMNPHFIFNCLNSIQHYFLNNDSQKANRYLTLFASLVRETLYFSGRQSVRISEEVNYLKRYLEMEQMRFGEHFVYSIYVDPDLQADFIEMPALLLQPYIENAIRHGIRHKSEGVGKLELSFILENDYLCCSIKDNGIGRLKSEAMKGRQHIEYQSKGMELGQKRVDILNEISGGKPIEIQVIDETDTNGNATGTTVIIKMPMNNEQTDNDTIGG
ncbi:sensor histidine kinase [Phnomibacter ginsenosidimutans]|uniref:Signal transduction histidine kinase internal region domain-containing protein n=1 Tax=Phnomibacter ginsenosidimutans TaxID=2676868 RepID=A0A6I6H219_9BACT|nr:histidine kinase [Phnomibacter ginsenosidimutans]QGW28661.1 hypothetical protein GLV81_11640 [Phnomibacter ginsenosidimutans]